MSEVAIYKKQTNELVSVLDAETIILDCKKSYGNEVLPFEECCGRILAADIIADRDFPSFDRVTMDGIAINYSAYQNGLRHFQIERTMAAGDRPLPLQKKNNCIEIMTGAALPNGTDSVIRYEDLSIENGIATILADTVSKGQNIHNKGKDRKKRQTVATANQLIDAAVIAVAASVGATHLTIEKLPRIAIISTGNELVNVNENPLDWQIRSSNNYAIQTVLKTYSINADRFHANDDPVTSKIIIQDCLSNYDVLLLTGGVSMGKFDCIPQILEEAGATKLFYKVQQKPGKPFWFGHKGQKIVFAFPGNPVSTFLCLHRYFIPWLKACLQLETKKLYAILNEDIEFVPSLHYFLQVKINAAADGKLIAIPVKGNGSGDYANLVEADAFMELPAEKTNFFKGEAYQIWPFKNL
ncbi:MAG: molybdopterin molybdotransferase MoeA [Bacteroidota bacterium]|nr:molybdopterin molybdotransferase MoeA [Bacteroidota bacterium]